MSIGTPKAVSKRAVEAGRPCEGTLMPDDASRGSLPSGTVTFLFTDIEGSTSRWENATRAMARSAPRHDAIVRRAVTRHRGSVFKTVGDEFCCAFSSAADAAAAAEAIQRGLAAEDFEAAGGIRVRIAIHSGVADERDGDYFGPAINRVARLLSVGHGGQTLLSTATAELVRPLPEGWRLDDLGQHELKDLSAPEHIWSLVFPGLSDTFPPLRTSRAPAEQPALSIDEHLRTRTRRSPRSAPSWNRTGW